MIIDGRKIAEDILRGLEAVRDSLPNPVRLGVVMSAGDATTESFIRIKSRAAERLRVDIVRAELAIDATTEDAIIALNSLAQKTHGIIVQLPLPSMVDFATVLANIPPTHDVDALGPEPRVVLAPVAAAVREIIMLHQVVVNNRSAVVVGAGRLVGAPCAELLRQLGANVSVITTEQGSLDDLKNADIVISGAGEPGLITPEMLKQSVVLIDAGTSEAGGKLVGDANPACASVSSVFTPVPGGVGPIAIAMIFRNLFTLIGNTTFAPGA